MRKLLISAVLAALALAGSARAQDLQFDQPADLVSALVVKARTPGPAWWKVSDADTTVWILGAPGVIPKSVTWDDTTLRRRLTGANLLILPPRDLANGLSALGLDKALSDKLPPSQRLPPALYTRLQAAIGGREEVIRNDPTNTGGKTVELKGEPKTMLIAMMLLAKADEPLGPLTREPAARAVDLASQLKIKTDIASVHDSILEMREAMGVAEPVQQACLSRALDVVEAGSRQADSKLARAQAWADGDVPQAVRPFDLGEVCPEPKVLQTWDVRQANAAVSAIQNALKKPGKVVAVVDLSNLLRSGGVLDQLKAKGLTITAPDVAQAD